MRVTRERERERTMVRVKSLNKTRRQPPGLAKTMTVLFGSEKGREEGAKALPSRFVVVVWT